MYKETNMSTQMDEIYISYQLTHKNDDSLHICLPKSYQIASGQLLNNASNVISKFLFSL